MENQLFYILFRVSGVIIDKLTDINKTLKRQKDKNLTQINNRLS
jgi:hypothetical protein